MQLNYQILKEKYLSYFNNNIDKCDFVLTDVLFAFNEIYTFVKDEKVKSILEIGSGTGILISELKKIFPEKIFTGIDPNESGFHNYQDISNKLAAEKKNLKILNTDIDNFKKDRKYDLIFSFNVFEHVLEQKNYLKKTYDLLEKNGKNIIFCPNYDFPYEPHFVLPIIFNKEITYKIFKDKILSHEKKTQEIGLWDGLNINGKKNIEKIMKKNNYSYTFDYSIQNRIFERLSNDQSKYFKKRQGIAGRLAIIGKLFYLDKIIFNILRVPFPYLKLIINKNEIND